LRLHLASPPPIQPKAKQAKAAISTTTPRRVPADVLDRHADACCNREESQGEPDVTRLEIVILNRSETAE